MPGFYFQAPSYVPVLGSYQLSPSLLIKGTTILTCLDYWISTVQVHANRHGEVSGNIVIKPFSVITENWGLPRSVEEGEIGAQPPNLAIVS